MVHLVDSDGETTSSCIQCGHSRSAVRLTLAPIQSGRSLVVQPRQQDSRSKACKAKACGVKSGGTKAGIGGVAT